MTSTALKNSSGTLLLQLAVPPLRVERLGWLPKLANPHATGHERSNQQGEKPDLPQRKPGSPRENFWLPTASVFCTDNLYLQQFWTLLAGSSPKIVFFCTAAFAVDISAHTSQMTLTALKEQLWHFAFTTSAEAPLQVARLGWLPREPNLLFFFFTHTPFLDQSVRANHQ